MGCLRSSRPRTRPREAHLSRGFSSLWFRQYLSPLFYCHCFPGGNPLTLRSVPASPGDKSSAEHENEENPTLPHSKRQLHQTCPLQCRDFCPLPTSAQLINKILEACDNPEDRARCSSSGCAGAAPQQPGRASRRRTAGAWGPVPRTPPCLTKPHRIRWMFPVTAGTLGTAAQTVPETELLQHGPGSAAASGSFKAKVRESRRNVRTAVGGHQRRITYSRAQSNPGILNALTVSSLFLISEVPTAYEWVCAVRCFHAGLGASSNGGGGYPSRPPHPHHSLNPRRSLPRTASRTARLRRAPRGEPGTHPAEPPRHISPLPAHASLRSACGWLLFSLRDVFSQTLGCVAPCPPLSVLLQPPPSPDVGTLTKQQDREN